MNQTKSKCCDECWGVPKGINYPVCFNETCKCHSPQDKGKKMNQTKEPELYLRSISPCCPDYPKCKCHSPKIKGKAEKGLVRLKDDTQEASLRTMKMKESQTCNRIENPSFSQEPSPSSFESDFPSLDWAQCFYSDCSKGCKEHLMLSYSQLKEYCIDKSIVERDYVKKVYVDDLKEIINILTETLSRCIEKQKVTDVLDEALSLLTTTNAEKTIIYWIKKEVNLK